MPLVIISGYPRSGKSYRAKQLEDAFNNLISSSTDPHHSRLSVYTVSDHSLDIKTSVYATANEEKTARENAMTHVRKLLTKDDIVIADGLNYIKGYRYQLWCEAKALSTPCCVVHIGATEEKCKENNTCSPETGDKPVYAPDDLKDLINRYEEPNGMNRWDSPLFIVVWDDESPPVEQIWEAIVGAPGSKKVVKPHNATKLKPATQPDYLYLLDKETSSIVEAIQTWLKDHDGETGGTVIIEACDDAIQLPTRSLTFPMLQSMRRQFISMTRQANEDQVKDRIPPRFVDHLNNQFNSMN